MDVLNKTVNNTGIKEVINTSNIDNIHNIPKEIKDINRWLYSNQKKAPCNKDGYNIDWSNEINHNTFLSVTNNNPNKLYRTYALGGDYVIVDMDKCFDDNKVLYDWAKEVLKNLDIENTKPYIEYSISGYGLHIIYKINATLSKKINKSIKLHKVHSKYSHLPKKSGIEVFTQKHCMILTGNVYEGYRVDNLPKAGKKVNQLYTKLDLLSKIDINKVKDKYQRNTEMRKENIDNVFDFVKSEVDIVDVLEKYDIDYNGKLINCPLPNHQDDTPSMAVYEVTNSFNCFGCNQGGSIIDFIALMEDITPFEAIKKLNDMFDLKIDFSKQNQALEKDWFYMDDNNNYKLDYTRLRNHLVSEHHIINSEQNTYIYDNGVYKEIEKYELTKLIENHMIESDNNKFKESKYVDEVYKQLLREFKKFNEFNKSNTQINMKNCILNVEYGSSKFTKEEHSPDQLSTIQLKHNYNPEATCETFNKFLDDILPKYQQKLLQEVMGYSLIPNNRAKKFFMLYGKGDTGKSVVLNILTKVIGVENCSGEPLQDLTKKSSVFDTYSLLNKLVNVCADLPSTPIEDTSIIKILTGDDYMKYVKKGMDAIFGFNTARLYFSANQLPMTYDKSSEFFNRFIIIPFKNVCPKDKQDNEILNKFNYEAIFNWMFEGLLRLMSNNLNFSTTSENDEIIKDYITQDSPVVDFVNEWFDQDENGQLVTSDLLHWFKLYCDEENIKFKKSGTQLRSEIANKFKSIKESKHVVNPKTKKPTSRGLIGLKIKDDILSQYQHLLNF